MASSRSRKETHYAKALEWLPLDAGDALLEYGVGRGEGLGVLGDTLSDEVFVVAMDPVINHLCRAQSRTRPNSSGPRISFLQNQPNRVPVMSGVFAGIILAYVLHESESPRSLLRNLAGALTPRGRLVVLETRPEPPLASPHLRHGMSPQRARELLNGSGFTPLPRRDLHRRFYMLRGRPGGPAAV